MTLTSVALLFFDWIISILVCQFQFRFTKLFEIVVQAQFQFKKIKEEKKKTEKRKSNSKQILLCFLGSATRAVV